MGKVKVSSMTSAPATLHYVAIAARYKSKWLFVRHRERGGYELPAGHPCSGESDIEAAVRELVEETGARDFIMEPVTWYRVNAGSGWQYGRLFTADIETLGEVSDTSEIEGVKLFSRLPVRLSLPEVMTFLYRMAIRHVRYTQC